MIKMVLEKHKRSYNQHKPCPTGYSGATSLPVVGDSFMYIETSQNTLDSEIFFVSSEQTDFFQISSFCFNWNRFVNI